MNEFFKSILMGIYGLVGNYGWSIVVFTLLIRLVLFPFDYKSRVSMRKMTKIQPKMNALQIKYGKDPEKLNRKTAELYRTEGISPFSSCLPMLISLPLLWVMFDAMRMVANENLVQQTFSILQGQTPAVEGWFWVKNVWMPDSPFSAILPDLNSLRVIPTDIWVNAFNALGNGISSLPADLALTVESFSSANLTNTITEIVAHMNTMPLYQELTATAFNVDWIIVRLSWMQHMNGFFILPLLSAVTQYLMTILQPTQTAAANPNDPQAQTMQSTNAMMKWFFPLFSLWICSSYNAVFAIYWVVSNVFMAISTFISNKILDAKEAKAAETAKEDTLK